MPFMSPVPVPSALPVVQAGGFGENFFALDSAGNLFTWGMNEQGQCGLGHNSAVTNPTLAATGVLNVYTTPSTSCVYRNLSRLFIQKSDGIYGAGRNTYGQLGDGTTTARNTFVLVFTAPPSSIVGVWNLGTEFGCTFLRTTTGVWCWGYNGYGQLGTGDTVSKLVPTDVTAAWRYGASDLPVDFTGGFGYSSDTAHSESTVVARTAGGVIRACGNGSYGMLGNGSNANISTPSAPATPTFIDMVVVGGGPGAVFALTASGDVWCWGYNSNGMLSDGTVVQKNVPAKHPTLSGVDKILSRGIDSPAYSYNANAFFRMRAVDGVQAVMSLSLIHI